MTRITFYSLLILMGILLFALGGLPGCSCGDDDDDDDDNDDAADDDDSDDDDDDSDDDTSGVTCYEDGDGDGYGNPDSTQVFADECDDGWVQDDTDCDDEHEDAHPGGIDLPDDNIDGDCVGGDFEATDENGVFVSSTGNDANPGTMAAPKQTIQAGVDAAGSKGKSVFVAGASYVNGVSTAVSLYGGYNDTFTARDPDAYLTFITGPFKASVTITTGANIVINGFTINGGLDDGASYAVWIGGSALLIKNKIQSSNSATNSCGVRIHDVTTIAKLIDNDIDGGAGSDESIGVSVLLDATAILEKNMIDAGQGANQSRGVAVHEATLTLKENDISGGTSNSTTGVVIDDGTVTMTNNTIDGGTSTNNSTGIRFDEGVLTAQENSITGGTQAKGSKAKLPESTGLALLAGEATITRNTIHGGVNHLTNGVFVSDAQVTLDSNTIACGTSDGEGYGVYLQGTTTLVNNLILSQGCTGYCMVASVKSGTSTLVNNTLIGGDAQNAFGLDIQNSNVIAINNIIDPGSGTTSCTGVRITTSPTAVSLINNDIWGADMTLLMLSDAAPLTEIDDVNDCANWAGNCAQTAGNISNNPGFVNPGAADYHINDASCVDAGADPATWYTGTLADTDFEGDARPTGAGWDIGMDEYTSAR